MLINFLAQIIHVGSLLSDYCSEILKKDENH